MVRLNNVTEHYKNLSLNNISEIIDGILVKEEWKDIVGYEGKYEISSFGRVKSLKYKRKNQVKLLKQQLIKAGYLRVELSKKGNRKFVHRLVAQAFIENSENKPEVNHIFGVTTDNRVSMLEWATKSEQQIHAQKVLGFKPNLPPIFIGSAHPSAKKIIMKDKNTGEVLKYFNCIMDAAIYLKINNSCIVNALKGRYKTSKGYKWEYA